MAISERSWDTTCDFLVIPSLKLGGERIEGHDTISSTEVVDYLDETLLELVVTMCL